MKVVNCTEARSHLKSVFYQDELMIQIELCMQLMKIKLLLFRVDIIINRLLNSTFNSIIYKEVNNMVNIVTANDLKVKGVSILDEITSETGEAIISVRGKNKYVVLSMEEYNQLREYELDAAIKESQDDIVAGRVFDESIEAHIKRITSV